jgi:sugar lactone lactonase YvrE
MTSTVITRGDIEITGTGIFKGNASGLTNVPYSGDSATFNRLTVNSNTNLGSYAPTNIAVITLAGSGAAAFLDGTMEGASFNKPHGVAVSPDGIIYIADASNNRIRKVTPGGVVTTLASLLNSPRGVAVGPDGNIYVAETDGNLIRKVTPQGVVATLAGSGTAGSTDGIGTSASFNSPRGVAVDRNGDIYVADCNNNRIRKVTPGGVVTTLAGSGTAGSANGIGGAASFNSPKGISIGPDRTIYVADSSNNLIRKITRAGDVTTFVGIGGTEFNDPRGISVDSSGNVFVADTVNNLIRKVSPGGVITTLAGSGNDVSADGIGTAASFNRPSGLAFGPDGSIYVADTNTHSIRKIHSGLSSLNMTGNTYVSNYITSGGNVNVNGNLDVSGNTNLRGGVNAYGIFDVSGVVNIYGPLYVPRVEASSILTSTVIAPQLFISSIMTSTLTAPQLFISSILTSTVIAPQLFVSSIMTSTLTAPQLFISSIMTSTVITRGDIEITGTGIFRGNGSGLTNLPNALGNLGVVIGQTNAVTTLAGSGSATFADGTGAQASFKNPFGVAVAPDGTIYVADTDNHCIRKVTPGGVVTTLAGSSAGGIDGTGTGAQFNGPSGLAIGPDGNIYVADRSNHRIRKVTPGGVVTTLAGSGANAFADGTGTAASFHEPQAIAIGPDGTIYVADRSNQRIRKVTPGGVVTTLAGNGTAAFADGTGSAARFNYPQGVAVGPDGNIYVGEFFNHRIRKVTPGGVVTTLAGSGSITFADGTGSEASFAFPEGVAVGPDGTIYVADSGNHRIRKMIFNGSAWVVTTLAGSGSFAFADGIGAAASFKNPVGVAVGPDGTIYIGDSLNHRIRKIDSGLSSLNMAGNSYFTNYITAGGNMNVNGDLDVSGNTDLRGAANVYGTLTANSNINLGGLPRANNVVTTLAGSGSAGSTNNVNGLYASFNTPLGVAVASDGTIYVADFTTHLIRKVTPGGVVTTLAGSSAGGIDGTGPGAQFNGPSGLAIGPDGNIYVAEFSGHRIRKVTPNGVVTTLAGNGSAAFADGTGSAARFSYPAAVAVSPDGTIYVADYANYRIRIVTLTGVVTTLAGDGTAAPFNEPVGVAIGPDGNIYVTEYSGNRVSRLNTGGQITRLAGSTDNTAGYVDATGSAARFDSPQGIVVDRDGSIYVTDRINDRIRKMIFNGTEWVVTTLAGNATAGFADGTGTAASFNEPVGVAIGPDGTIYIGDSRNHRIRKIDSGLSSLNMAGNAYFTNFITAGGNVNVNGDLDVSGNTDLRGVANVYGSLNIQANPNRNLSGVRGPINVVTTLAGSGSYAFADGTGADATFKNPSAVAVDTDGSIYIADASNNRIRKVTPGGVVTTFAGTGAAGFINDGTTSATLTAPEGLAIDTDVIYVADTGNNRIRIVNKTTRVVTTLAGGGVGTGGDGGGFLDELGTRARLNQPRGIIIHPNGFIYIADSVNNRIRKVNKNTGEVSTVAGNGEWGAVDQTGAAARFGSPRGIACDINGFIYVADYDTNRIRRVTIGGLSDREVTTVAGNGTGTFLDGTGTGASFNNPTGIFVDSSRYIYVADAGNHRIRKMINNGTAWVVTTLAGNAAAGFADGTGVAASFNSPRGVAVGPDGTIYVADASNHRLCKIDSADLTLVNIKGNLDVSGNTNLIGGVKSYKTSIFSPDLLITSPDSVNNKILRFTVDAGATWIQSGSALVGGSTSPLYFSGMYGGNIRMAIDGGGNVGIGTTSPRNRLNIASDFPFANMTNGSLRTSAQIAITGATTSANLYIGTAYTAGGGSGSVIQSTDFFTVASAATPTDNGLALYLNPNGGSIIFGDAVNFKTGRYNVSSDEKPRFWFENNAETRFMSGNGRFTFKRTDLLTDNLVLENNGNLTATGDVTAYSDVRSKTNIVEIDSPLEKIMKMRGVYYNRIDDSNAIPDRHLGVIAQEIERVLPEVVLTDTSESKHKSVAYGNIVAILIEGMKAQQSTIKGIQAILSSRT